MPSSIAAAKAGVTTGEWGFALRDIFGEYRAPTGVGSVSSAVKGEEIEKARDAVKKFEKKTGEKLRILVGKPGLDGHSNGAEQIAVRARDAGMEVIYQGIRLTPEQIVESALQEGVHVIGLSILSGSHLTLIPAILKLMKDELELGPLLHECLFFLILKEIVWCSGIRGPETQALPLCARLFLDHPQTDIP